MNVFPNGLGAATGDSFVTCEPLQVSGNVIWANSTTGSDSNSGENREAPKKTLAAALAVASAQDTVVLMDGFTETVTQSVSPLAGVTVVGEGQSGGKPTCKLKASNPAGTPVFEITAAATRLRNLYFEASATTNAQPIVLVEAPGTVISNCYFECGPTDIICGLKISVSCYGDPDYTTIENTTFVSTAIVATDLPADGLLVAAAADYLTLSGVTFDDGPFGFDNDYAMNCDATVTGLFATGVSLLRGASLDLTNATGKLNVSTRTGGGRVKW